VFHFDRGLFLTKAGLAVDVTRRQPRAFISHAHNDHMARHQYALCTPETARLYQWRLGRRDALELPYGQPKEWGGLRLTTYPAGHCLGSAMLLAEDGGASLLYTGDFKLRPSITCPPAQVPQAQVLVIESTFGDPDFRFAPRHESAATLIELVRETIAAGRTPVVEAYVVGKAQEVTRLLTDAGIPVLQHKAIYEVSRLYEACGVPLGNFALYPGYCRPGHAVVAPPRQHRNSHLPRLLRPVRIAVSGWALHERTRRKLGADHAVALSDHADYDELLATIEQVGAREIYCTHGPVSFVERLRSAGLNAFRLGGIRPQLAPAC
jgi:Cft2 family RNA processing exonuclease